MLLGIDLDIQNQQQGCLHLRLLHFQKSKSLIHTPRTSLQIQKLYCLGVIVAFYVLHYPVIATIDYLLFGYWDLSVNPLLGWMLVLVTMTVVTLALIELVVRPIPPLRFLLGVSRRRLPSPPTSGVKESTPVK